MPRPLPVALVQHPPSQGLDAFADEVATVKDANPQVRLMVFPEVHLGERAEPLDGDRHRRIGQIAREHGLWLVPGSVAELGADGREYNTALVYSPEGERVAAYRKVFPWRPYEKWTPGAEFTVVDLPGIGRAGLSICYDSWFPEVTRHLAWMGAEFVVNVVKTTGSDRAQELVLARANAIVNQVFVLSVNTAGPVGAGRSLIVDPEGRVRVEAPSEAPSVLTDVVDLDAVTVVREHGTAGLNRMWQQLRPDDAPIPLPLYGGRIDPHTWTPGTSTQETR